MIDLRPKYHTPGSALSGTMAREEVRMGGHVSGRCLRHRRNPFQPRAMFVHRHRLGQRITAAGDQSLSVHHCQLSKPAGRRVNHPEWSRFAW